MTKDRRRLSLRNPTARSNDLVQITLEFSYVKVRAIQILSNTPNHVRIQLCQSTSNHHVRIQLCQSTSNLNTTKHSKSRSIISCPLSSVCGFMSYNNFSLCWPLTDYTFSYIQDPCMLREIMDIRVVFRGIRRCLHAPFSRPPYLQAQPTVAQH